MIETKLISSLGKVFTDTVKGDKLKNSSVLANEPFSFQLAFKAEKVTFPVYTKIVSDLPQDVFEEYKIDYVPLTNARMLVFDEDGYADYNTPGLYPDIMLPRKVNCDIVQSRFDPDLFTEIGQKHLLQAMPDSYNSVWFTVNADGKVLKSGEFNITVELYDARADKLLSSNSFTLKIYEQTLPKQDFLYTAWFHADCLADIYNVEMFSDRHFEIMRNYIKEAAKTGMNMILLPAFTPALDTPVGWERKTAQLMKIKVVNGEYEFDFSLMERFVKMCFECGITHFEHCHFFSQWGAEHAPKIIAEVNGQEKQIFGWDTDSLGKEYEKFLKAYLKVLLPWLDKVGIGKNILFHISDEPGDKHLKYYDNALRIIGEEIKDYMSGDAMSSYKFYENGSVKIPIISVKSADMPKFIENCADFWAYYTGDSAVNNCTNRLIHHPAARNRILGIESYYTGAKGFLNWGYNYYYDVLSQGLFDPKINPSGFGMVNATPGASYVVYPDYDGSALPSMRMKVFYEGINDYRALKTYEALTGRDTAKALVEKHFGKIAFNALVSENDILSFREELNLAISNA